MLGYYLKKRDNDSRGGCRGGIGRDDGEDYCLEIGQDCHADPEMIAFLVFMPEIEEILKLYADKSPLIRLTLRAMSKELQQIKNGLEG